MSTIYHTPIEYGAIADDDTFNDRLGALDAGISDAMSYGLANQAEIAAARSPYISLDARLDYMETVAQLSGGNVATNANGASAAGQKVLTVNDTTGFIVGAHVEYLLNNTTLEDNVIASIQAGVSLTLTTNIGTGGVLDDSVVSMVPLGQYLAAQSIPHAGTLMLPDTIEYANQATYNVAAYTVAGDTDTERIQAALDAADAAGGGTVFVEPGVYDIEDVLIVYSNTTVTATAGTVTLRGAAGAYTGKTVDSTTVYATIGAVGASNVVIENLIVDHATNATEANGIALMPAGGGPNFTGTQCDKCVIRNCQILGMTGDHQYLIWAFKTTNTTIYCNYLDGGTVSYTPGDQQEGIEVAGGTNVLVFGNTCMNIGANGIYVSCAGVTGTERIGVRVTDNYCENCTNGVHSIVEAASTQSLEQLIVSNNVVRGGWENGIKFSMSTDGIASGCTISHNQIYDVALKGMYIQAGSTTVTSGGILVDGNYVEHQTTAGGFGIYVENLAGVRVTNNFVRDAYYGYYVKDSTDVDLIGNRAEDVARNGINVLGCTRIVIDENVLKNYDTSGVPPATTYEGIIVATSSYISLRNNTFKRSEAAGVTETYAINLANTCSLAYIDGNRLEYESGFNPAIRCDATDSNVGSFTVSAASTYTLTNAMLRGGALLFLQQETEAPVYYTAVRSSDGVFLITFNTTTSGLFKYKISRNG